MDEGTYYIQGGPKSNTPRTYITLYERYHFFGPPGRPNYEFTTTRRLQRIPCLHTVHL